VVPQAEILATHIYVGLLLLKHQSAEGSSKEYEIELQVGSCFTALDRVVVYMHAQCRRLCKAKASGCVPGDGQKIAHMRK